MSGYTPLFGEIVTSSIWNEENAVRIVWITLMAMADMDGNVMASVAGLAPVARVSIKECENAINILSSPDKYSRSKEKEGRRIEPIDGGWHLVNHSKYRKKAKSRAAYMRKYREEKKKAFKEEKNLNPNPKANSHSNANSVTPRNITQQSVTVTQFTEKECIQEGKKLDFSEQQCKEFFNYYNAQGWVFNSGKPIADLASALERWKSPYVKK